MRLWIGLLLLSQFSCDKVLGLKRHYDAQPDVADIDADLRPDAIDCVVYPGGQPDEDGDGRNDFCDNCPTVANSDQVDGDGDMVGFACDPAPVNAGDRIAFFSPMVNMENLAIESGVVIAGSVAVITNGKLSVTVPVKPVRVVAELSIRTFESGHQATIELADAPNVWSCNVGYQLPECQGDNCLYMRAPGTTPPNGTMLEEPHMTARVVMQYQGSNGFGECIAEQIAGPSHPRSISQSMPTSLQAQGTLAVKMNGQLELRSVIVYDRPMP